MRVRELAPWQTGHQYPEGEGPEAMHPPKWGPLVKHRFCEVDGVAVVVHSTERNKIGVSYNVVEQRDQPAWVSYFHHRESGNRVRVHNSPNSLNLTFLLDAL